MKIKKIVYCLFFVFLASYTYALDLSDYPDIFVDGRYLDVVLVVGEAAVAEDVIAVSDIAISLQQNTGIDVGPTKLSSQVDLYSQNVIVVGNACTNEAAAELLGNPSNCFSNLEEGESIIRLTKEGESYQLLVGGYSETETRDASRVLVDFDSYDFRGTEIKITESGDGNFDLEYGFAEEKDLSDFPELIIKDNRFDAIIVVGNDASSSDVIAQTNLVLFFGQVLGLPVLGATKLASEISNLNRNIISIGNSCKNEITSKIMNNPKPCDRYQEKGKGFIRLFEDNAYIYLVAAGLTDEGTREAVKALINYDEYDLIGKEIIVEIEEKPEPEQGIEEISMDEQKEKMIEVLSKKSLEETEEVTENIETETFEEVEEKIKPQPISAEEDESAKEDGLVKKFISWLLALFK